MTVLEVGLAGVGPDDDVPIHHVRVRGQDPDVPALNRLGLTAAIEGRTRKPPLASRAPAEAADVAHRPKRAQPPAVVSCRGVEVLTYNALSGAAVWTVVCSLLNARTRFARRQRRYPRPGSRSRRGTWRQGVEGRWTLLPAAPPVDEVDELAETAAWQLLLRWGVVFRDVYLKERLAIPWREILWALRRLEARGLIRGGRFVTGVTGEQFAAEATLPLLRPRRAR